MIKQENLSTSPKPNSNAHNKNTSIINFIDTTNESINVQASHPIKLKPKQPQNSKFEQEDIFKLFAENAMQVDAKKKDDNLDLLEQLKNSLSQSQITPPGGNSNNSNTNNTSMNGPTAIKINNSLNPVLKPIKSQVNTSSTPITNKTLPILSAKTNFQDNSQMAMQNLTELLNGSKNNNNKINDNNTLNLSLFPSTTSESRSISTSASPENCKNSSLINGTSNQQPRCMMLFFEKCLICGELIAIFGVL